MMCVYRLNVCIKRLDTTENKEINSKKNIEKFLFTIIFSLRITFNIAFVMYSCIQNINM